MNRLDTDRINDHSPYLVVYDESELVFTTDYGIHYAVDFDDDANPYFTAYWLNLSNISHQSSPGDKKIPQTLICIVEEFFRVNPDILLYMCSTDNEQQAQRARLFLRWFNSVNQRDRYVVYATDVKGIERKEYVALIAQKNNPQLATILTLFANEISMFNENKP